MQTRPENLRWESRRYKSHSTNKHHLVKQTRGSRKHGNDVQLGETAVSRCLSLTSPLRTSKERPSSENLGTDALAPLRSLSLSSAISSFVPGGNSGSRIPLPSSTQGAPEILPSRLIVSGEGDARQPSPADRPLMPCSRESATVTSRQETMVSALASGPASAGGLAPAVLRSLLTYARSLIVTCASSGAQATTFTVIWAISGSILGMRGCSTFILRGKDFGRAWLTFIRRTAPYRTDEPLHPPSAAMFPCTTCFCQQGFTSVDYFLTA